MQAARYGASDEQLDALIDYENGPFTEAEKAALAYAEQLTVAPRAVPDALFDRLRRSYDEGEIVELSAMAGIFNYMNRVNDALGMQPTQPGEGL